MSLDPRAILTPTQTLGDGNARGGELELRAFVAAVALPLALFLCWLVYYGICLFPGLGGQVNAGDSAKFQILGHTPIMVHGPGYPLVLLLGVAVRALALPQPEWWVLTFALSVIPAATANVVAFLVARYLTGSVTTGIAASLLLGSAGLMAVQATEAEVYALTLAFLLTTSYLLVRFVGSGDRRWFVAACGVYAFSFGNHLMMIMYLPVFAWLAILHRRDVLRPGPIAAILLLITLGASQYGYLAHVAYDPATSYSEYMPLPPQPMELVRYVLGTYFTGLYQSGLSTPRTLDALVGTLRFAHPWLSLPLIAGGLLLFVAGWKRRQAGWRGLAILYGGALCFVPFTLWYGVPDIQAFHLPVLGPLLVAAVSTVVWTLRPFPALFRIAVVVLLAVGVARTGQTAVLLADREPMFDRLPSVIREIVRHSPVDRPIVAMEYGLRMATLYHELRGELPNKPIYRLHWRAIAEVRDQPSVAGIVVPTDGNQFVRWIEHRRPDLSCRTEKIVLPEDIDWPAYAFECGQTASSAGDDAAAN